jgi:streptomycin 3"-adenylyltransferase
VNPRQFAGDLTAALGRVGPLAAAYLHGSAALGGWNAERSDVDILFVASDDIGADAVAAIGDLLLTRRGPGRGLECSVVTSSQAARPCPPYPFLLHSGQDAGAQRLYSGSEMPGDSDLIMHYAVCREAGITLYGPPPQDCIGAVPRQAILTYLAGELEWGLANGAESYAVLNACRALVYLESRRIVSKVAGGKAALERGTGPEAQVRLALDAQYGISDERRPGPDATAFVRSVITRLEAGS